MANLNIKFSKYNSDFIKELRARVNEYFEKRRISKDGNSKIMIKSVVMLTIYLAPLALMLSQVITSDFGIVASWLIMGVGMASVGMVLMHDANHGSYSQSSKTNKFLSKSLYLLGGFPPNWRFQHNTLHHGYTNVDGADEDIAPFTILRFSPHKPLYKIHRFQYLYAWFFYCLLTVSWVTGKDFNRLFKYKRVNAVLSRKNNFTLLLFDLIISKLLYYVFFLVLPIIVLPIAWYWTVLLFLGMHFVGGLILCIIFQSAHVMPSSEYPLPDEKGDMDNNWAVHQLLTTSDFAPNSKIFSWFIGGLNYQIEHHLFPNISHVHYHRISHIVKKTALKYQLPYNVQPNFFAAIRSHTKMLKSLGK